MTSSLLNLTGPRHAPLRPAVDREDRPGGVARGVAGEVERGPDDLLRVAGAAEGERSGALGQVLTLSMAE